MKPSKKILEEFGIRGRITQIKSGQGETYRCGNIFLKPATNEEEIIWIAETFSRIQQKGFRLANYVKTKDGRWIADGWYAQEKVTGKATKGDYEEKLSALRLFHKELRKIKEPAFIKKRQDPWARADRMAFGEQQVYCTDTFKPIIKELTSRIKPISLSNQITHCDPGTNTLIEKGKPPAIIDITVYWRPEEYSYAVLFFDAITWNNASDDLLELFDSKEAEQLLLRAAIARICVESIRIREKRIPRNEDEQKKLVAAGRIVSYIGRNHSKTQLLNPSTKKIRT